MRADRERLEQRALGEADALGQAQRLAGADPHPLRIAARHGRREAETDDAGAGRGQALAALAEGLALRAGSEGDAGGAVAGLPIGMAGGDDRAGEFMAEHRARLQAIVRHLGRVEVATADAAEHDLQQQVARAGLGLRLVGQGELMAQPLEDGGAHGTFPRFGSRLSVSPARGQAAARRGA
jgi:hypothetical protein